MKCGSILLKIYRRTNKSNFFNLKKSVAEAHPLLVEVCGLSKRSCVEWFHKFNIREFNAVSEGRRRVRKCAIGSGERLMSNATEIRNNCTSFKIVRNVKKQEKSSSMYNW